MRLADEAHSEVRGSDLTIPCKLVLFEAFPNFVVFKPRFDLSQFTRLDFFKIFQCFYSSFLCLVYLDCEDLDVLLALIDQTKGAKY